MADTVNDLARKYQGMDPRQIRDLLRSPTVRSTVGSSMVNEMTIAAQTRYWPQQVRDIYSLIEKGYSGQDLYEKAEDKLGLLPYEVDQAIDYAEKTGLLEHGTTVTWD